MLHVVHEKPNLASNEHTKNYDLFYCKLNQLISLISHAVIIKMLCYNVFKKS